jgi:creatinine amidohydrolase
MSRFGVLLVFLATAGCQPAMESPSAVENDAVLPSIRVHNLEQLTQDEIDTLDRDKSIFFLTFGNLEEHGPHMPVGSDYYRAIGIRNGLINRLHDTHPDYQFVLFPVVPIGVGGANDLVREPDHIGTYSVRYETLRNTAIDLGGTIARKGFRNIFVIEAHGDQLHNVAFNQAADFVSERYNVRMVNITGMSKTFEGSTTVLDEFLGEGWQERSGFEGHAGASETSEVLAVQGGEYVRPDYNTLEPFYVDGFRGFTRTYELEGWRGYWGDPARASLEMGEALIEQRVARAFQIAEAALRGDDLRSMPRYPDNNADVLSETEESRRLALERYGTQRVEIDRWLQQNPWPSEAN